MNNKKKIVLVVMVLAIFVTCFLTGSFNEDCTIPYKATVTVSDTNYFSQLMKADKKKDAEITIKVKTSGVYFLETYARNSKVDRSNYTYSISDNIISKPETYEYPSSSTSVIIAARLTAGKDYTWKFRNKKEYSQYDVRIHYAHQNYGTEYDEGTNTMKSLVWINQLVKDKNSRNQNVVTGYINSEDDFGFLAFLAAYESELQRQGARKGYILDVGKSALQLIFDSVLGEIPLVSTMLAVKDFLVSVVDTPEEGDPLLAQYVAQRQALNEQLARQGLNKDDYGVKVTITYDQVRKKYTLSLTPILDVRGYAPQRIVEKGNAGVVFYV